MSDGFGGNPLLKRSGVPIEWTPELVREYGRCANDPIYFAEKYIKIVHVDHGFIPIELYEYQKEIIDATVNNRRVVCNTSRQAGKCVVTDTLMRVRHANTGEIVDTTVGEFHLSQRQNIGVQQTSGEASISVRTDTATIPRPTTNHKLSETVERKFIDSFELDGSWEIETDTGWHEITHTHKTVEYVEWALRLANGLDLVCADTHIIFTENMDEVFVKDLSVGDQVMTRDGPIYVTSVEETTNSSNMYDLTVDSEDHRFYTNGILSHNTTTAMVIILHYILFNEYKTVALLANKAAAALEILNRIQMAYEALPGWMQQGVVTWNKGSMELENGCKVIAGASSSSSIRGKSISFLYIDETAFLNNWDEFFSSVYPTISSGKETKILLTSTPNSLNHFWKICKEAQEDVNERKQGKNGYIYIEVAWDRVPGRDQEWKDDTLASIGWNTEQFDQEFDCGFVGSTNTLISGQALKNLSHTTPILESENIKQYTIPAKDHTYVLIADVSRGKGLDHSAFSVIDITEMPYTQVCTFRDNYIGPVDYAAVIFRIAKVYNEAQVMIEINDIGGQVADIMLLDYGYDNIIFTENAGRSGKRVSGGFGKNVDRGIRTTSSVKRTGCAILKMLVEQNQIVLPDFSTIQELSRFSRKANSYEAESGSNDDMVMTLVLFSWLTDQLYFKDLTDINTMMKLREKTDEQVDEDLLPFGFINDGSESDENVLGYEVVNWM